MKGLRAIVDSFLRDEIRLFYMHLSLLSEAERDTQNMAGGL
jgi:hypothetical protein